MIGVGNFQVNSLVTLHAEPALKHIFEASDVPQDGSAACAHLHCHTQ